ncbi:dihydropteroate synthase [Flavobacteriaceae bacterium]|nr:dihydropteroate synthase [Flavobacteriaceae bacterium]MDB4289452.1 dihydropteroate synthase [Flavobacteriaceae bacterium]
MTLNCNGQLIDLNTPKVMGILNVTPDSFYDGGRFKDEKSILTQVEKLLKEGATFIDIGAYSSRPGADFVSEEEELKRLIPIVNSVIKSFPDAHISIDSFRSRVVKTSLEAGAAMVNDISGGQLDPLMFETVGALSVPYIMMHMRGTPQTMQKMTNYSDVVKDVYTYFSERIQLAQTHQIKDIILDLGFGFSKTIGQNFKLLAMFDYYSNLNLPILAGVSRKSMIYKTLNTTADQALNGSTALHMVALQKGAKLLRVHDVKEAMECIQLHEALQK